MKVAIVCDWLTSVGGAERVLRSICDLFPEAPIYTSQYNERKIDWFKDRSVHVGWLQIFRPVFVAFSARFAKTILTISTSLATISSSLLLAPKPNPSKREMLFISVTVTSPPNIIGGLKKIISQTPASEF